MNSEFPRVEGEGELREDDGHGGIIEQHRRRSQRTVILITAGSGLRTYPDLGWRSITV